MKQGLPEMLDFLVLGLIPGTSIQISFDLLLNFLAAIAAFAIMVDQRAILKLEFARLTRKYHQFAHRKIST